MESDLPTGEGEYTTQHPPPGDGAKCRAEVYLLGHILRRAKTNTKITRITNLHTSENSTQINSS